MTPGSRLIHDGGTGWATVGLVGWSWRMLVYSVNKYQFTLYAAASRTGFEAPTRSSAVSPATGREGKMDEGLETPEQLARGMADRSPADALLYVVDWLDRRDHLSDEIVVEHLAGSLEVLAAELRTEAVENLSPETKGLLLGATVLLDAARGARTGDELAAE